MCRSTNHEGKGFLKYFCKTGSWGLCHQSNNWAQRSSPDNPFKGAVCLPRLGVQFSTVGCGQNSWFVFAGDCFLRLLVSVLERGLSGLESFLLFQRTRVCFLAPISGGPEVTTVSNSRSQGSDVLFRASTGTFTQIFASAWTKKKILKKEDYSYILTGSYPVLLTFLE